MADSTVPDISFNVTEHSHNTEVNIVFINIDWKKSRHNTQKTTVKNLASLHRTIISVVQQMRPAVICMCEVGNAGRTLSADQMRLLVDECESA